MLTFTVFRFSKSSIPFNLKKHLLVGVLDHLAGYVRAVTLKILPVNSKSGG